MRRPLANSLANGPITEQIFTLSLFHKPGVKRGESLGRERMRDGGKNQFQAKGKG